jgi:hypothetical protein
MVASVPDDTRRTCSSDGTSDDFFRHLDLGFGRRAERQAARGRILHRLHHVRMGVADDRRAPRTDVVDITLAVRIPEVRAFGAGDEARRAAHRTEGAHRRVDAARRGFLGAFKQLVVFGNRGHVGISKWKKRFGTNLPMP